MLRKKREKMKTMKEKRKKQNKQKKTPKSYQNPRKNKKKLENPTRIHEKKIYIKKGADPSASEPDGSGVASWSASSSAATASWNLRVGCVGVA